MKQTKMKRVISLILTLVFAFYLIPTQVYATVPEDELLPDEGFMEELIDEPNDEIPEENEEPEKEPEVVEEITNRRTESQKDFHLDNGMNLAVSYPYSVHYRENNTWQEIDNTLRTDEKDGCSVYRNTAGMWNVSLPALLSEQTGVFVEHGGYVLRMRLVGELTNEGDLTPAGEAIAKADEPLDPSMFQPQTAVLAKLSSGVQYADVFKDTDLRYDLISNCLKENVILHNPKEGLSAYQYTLETELELVLQEDGQILAYAADEQDPVFYLPAPYLYDAAYEHSKDIRIQLEKAENGYLLTYELPQEWLADEIRSYPVVLDPVVMPVYNILYINDRTVAENGTYSVTWGCNAVGVDGGSTNRGRQRFYIKYTNLPDLSSADVVVNSSITFTTAVVNYSMPVEAHQVLSEWDPNTITWSNSPSYKQSVEDYVSVSTADTEYTWDITNIAQLWYTTGSNTGILFKAPDAIENGGVQRYIQFWSCDHSAFLPLVLQIAYVNNCGLEGYWDYTSHSAGRAGTGYINDYTGNLVWILDGLGFAGNRMPVSIRHIYNANDKGNNNFGQGYGWRTNYNQLVYQWSVDSSYYVWEDEDGTRHYFKYKSSGTYEDENGSGLLLTTTGSGTTKYCITDKKDNKSYFDTEGRLTKISNNQATASSIQITYTTSTSKLISQITDGAGRKYKFVYTDSALSRINFLGTGTSAISYMTFTQNSSDLTSVGYPDGKSVTFTYNTHLLTSAKDVENYKLAYTYTTAAPFRVAEVKEKNGTTSGGSLAMEYAHNQTTFTDHNGTARSCSSTSGAARYPYRTAWAGESFSITLAQAIWRRVRR